MLGVVLVRYRRIQNDVRRLVQDRSEARSVGSGENANRDENLGGNVSSGELAVAQWAELTVTGVTATASSTVKTAIEK